MLGVVEACSSCICQSSCELFMHSPRLDLPLSSSEQSSVVPDRHARC
jgi:hypothetical protein